VDHDLFLRINDFAKNTEWAHSFARAFAKYGIVLFAVLFLWAWWVGRKDADPRTVAAAFWAPAACVIAIVLAQPIVHAVDRDRPYAHNRQVIVLTDRTTDPSFPSDHSTISGAAAAGLWFTRRRRIRVTAIILAVTMAGARVYVGAHYPGDALAGLAFGAAVGVLGGWLLIGPLTRLVNRLSSTALRPLLTSTPSQAPVGTPT
jgi:membrane-associated phospholipid phosphatase